MLKIKNKLSLILGITLLLVFSLVSANANAATGYEAHAIYRNGVIGSGSYSLQYHAGLVDEPNLTYFGPIVHIVSGDIVRYCSKEEFRGSSSNTIMGIYSKGVASGTRDLIKSMGRRLTTENISYTFFNMLEYASRDATWIFPGDINKIRCDGVVEYTYEYYSVKLQSPSGYWDVSRQGHAEKHTWLTTSPKAQSSLFTNITGVIN